MLVSQSYSITLGLEARGGILSFFFPFISFPLPFAFSFSLFPFPSLFLLLIEACLTLLDNLGHSAIGNRSRASFVSNPC